MALLAWELHLIQLPVILVVWVMVAVRLATGAVRWRRVVRDATSVNAVTI